MKEKTRILFGQGLFSSLSQNDSNELVEFFVETINKELSIDLFVDGCNILDTPFSLLEALGKTKFTRARIDVEKKINDNVTTLSPKIKSGEWPVTNLPDLIFDFYYKYFLELKCIAPAEIRQRAQEQLGRVQNKVFKDKVFKDFADYVFQDLINTQSHEVICYFLANDYAQRVDPLNILSDVFPDMKKREEAAMRVSHCFLNCMNNKNNISFFRVLDRHRRLVCMLANYKDVDYSSAYLHKKDFLDTYMIHFFLFGYNVDCKNHKTTILTMEKPENIIKRLEYCLPVALWFNKYARELGREQIFLNYGKIIFLDEKLDIVDIVTEDKLSYQEIN